MAARGDSSNCCLRSCIDRVESIRANTDTSSYAADVPFAFFLVVALADDADDFFVTLPLDTRRCRSATLLRSSGVCCCLRKAEDDDEEEELDVSILLFVALDPRRYFSASFAIRS